MSAPQVEVRPKGAVAVEAAIRAANERGRAALMVYLPAGYPDLRTSVECFKAAWAAGADVIEIGFPYSDPLIDGPTIQAANHVVLSAGQTPKDHLLLSEEVTSSVAAPCLVMTYFNIIWHYGGEDRQEAFARDAAAAGLLGTIIPDLAADEGQAWRATADNAGLAAVYLAAPSSTPDRLRATAELSTGFIYATSTLGVTGERESLAGTAKPLVKRLRDVTDKPVCVGIGVSSGEHANEVAQFADGVIVGSATTRAAGEGGPDGLARLVEELAAGCVR